MKQVSQTFVDDDVCRLIDAIARRGFFRCDGLQNELGVKCKHTIPYKFILLQCHVPKRNIFMILVVMIMVEYSTTTTTTTTTIVRHTHFLYFSFADNK